MATAATTLAFSIPGGPEWIVILVIGLLIFGRRLPDVGRSIGKTVVEFRKGIREVENDIKSADEAPVKHESTQQSLPSEAEAESQTVASGSLSPEPAPKPE